MQELSERQEELDALAARLHVGRRISSEAGGRPAQEHPSVQPAAAPQGPAAAGEAEVAATVQEQQAAGRGAEEPTQAAQVPPATEPLPDAAAAAVGVQGTEEVGGEPARAAATAEQETLGSLSPSQQAGGGDGDGDDDGDDAAKLSGDQDTATATATAAAAPPAPAAVTKVAWRMRLMHGGGGSGKRAESAGGEGDDADEELCWLTGEVPSHLAQHLPEALEVTTVDAGEAAIMRMSSDGQQNELQQVRWGADLSGCIGSP